MTRSGDRKVTNSPRLVIRRRTILILLVLALAVTMVVLDPSGEAQADSIGTSIMGFLGFNANMPPFDDVRIRRAIAYAIDRCAISKIVFEGQAHPSYSIVTSHLSQERYFPDRDLEKAKELLAEAGYSDGFAIEIGFSGASGPCLPLPFRNSHDIAEKIALVLQEDLALVGIDVKLRFVEVRIFYELVREGGIGAFIYFLSFTNLHSPMDFVTMFLEDFPESFSAISFTDPEIDQLLFRLKKEGDPEVRSAIVEESVQITAERVPLIPIWEILYYSDQYEPFFEKERLHEHAVLFKGQDLLRIYRETGLLPEDISTATGCRLSLSHFWGEYNENFAFALFRPGLDEIKNETEGLIREPVQGEVPEPVEDTSFDDMLEFLGQLLEGRHVPSAEEIDPTSRIFGYGAKKVMESYIEAQMASSMTYFPGQNSPVSGTGWVRWVGTTPKNADEVRYAHKWMFKGINVSVSIPAGVGFAVSGSSASFSSTLKKNRVLALTYSGIQPYGYLIWRAESLAGAFRFGTTWHMIVANDSDWM